METVLVPNYFENFFCKCGECRHPCCDGWGINVDEHEYFTLLGIDCSDRLRHKLDDAFVISGSGSRDAFASIRPNYLEQCPMLDEDGLCLLQKEKGEQMLPLVCRVYPRAVKKYGSRHEICMSCSCEETVELLLQTTSPLCLHEIRTELPFGGIPVYAQDAEKDRIRHEAIGIVGDETLPLRDRFARIGTLITGESPAKSGTLPDALAAIIGFLKKICRVSDSMRECSAAAFAYLGDAQGDELCEKFLTAQDRLSTLVPNLSSAVGRFIANHMLYESFPYVPECESTDTAFAAFCTAVAMIKFVTVCGMAQSRDSTDFCDLLASANRFLEHSDFYRVCSRTDHPHGMETLARFAAML